MSGAIARVIARMEDLLRSKRWKRSSFAHGRVSANTVRSVLQGKNCRVSTLVEMAEALDCDLVIDLQPRPIINGTVEYPQHPAHDSRK